MPLTDEELMCRFRQQKDAALFTELTIRHQDSIIRQCQHYLKDSEAAQDIAQEVLIRVFTKADTFREGHSFRNWLRGIVHNRCIDHLNQDKTELHQDISSKIADTIEDETTTDQVEKPTVEILEELLDMISGQDKLLLLLKYKERWSVSTISHSLNLSESAVKMRLSRAKEKMQLLLLKYRPK